MDKRLLCFLACSVCALAACATSRVPADAALATWASQYGYQPYTLNGEKVYCHAGTGDGSICAPEQLMASLQAKHEVPEFALHRMFIPGEAW
jgi:hypothetical protein